MKSRLNFQRKWNFSLFLFICIACLLFSTVSFAEATPPPRVASERLDPVRIQQVNERHKQRVDKFVVDCVDNSVLRTSKGYEWCAVEMKQLEHAQEEIDKVTAQLTVEHPQSHSCTINGTGESVLPADVQQLINASLEANPANCAKNTKVSDFECFQQLTCGALKSSIKRTALSGTTAINGILAAYVSSKTNCPSNGYQSDCATDVVVGVLKNVWGAFRGLFWELPKMIGEGSASALESLFKAEEVATNSLVKASELSDSEVKKWNEDPVGFLQNLMGAIYDSIAKAVKHTFGCEKWAGAPYASECLVSMKAWDCSTCNQKAGAICGVGGFAVGEIATAYFLGGAFAVGGSAYGAAKGPVLATTAKVESLIAANPSAAAIFRQAATIQAALMRHTEVPVRHAIATAKLTGEALGKIRSALPTSTEFSRTAGQIVFYPVNKYLDLTVDAFVHGYIDTGKVIYIGSFGSKTPQITAAIPIQTDLKYEIKLNKDQMDRLDRLGSDVQSSNAGVSVKYDRQRGVLKIQRNSSR